jgi:hypothetical protein
MSCMVRPVSAQSLLILLIILLRYFKQDEPASKLMTQTLSSIPSSQRASYSRLQAAIRAEYHSTMAARRNAEFLARLRAVTPGGSLAAHMRTDPRSPAAQKERLSRFGAFISAWCTSGMPGTKPFFEALWATMRLQVLPVELGGAGPRQIEWEIDDAVFKEAAGKDFMLEAIDILKGVSHPCSMSSGEDAHYYHQVLGFEDSTASKRSDIWSRPNSSVGPIPESHQRSHSQPLSTHVPPSGAKGIATTTAARARAPSDPFLDSHTPRLSRSLASTQPRSPTTPTADVGMLEASGLLPTPPEDAATDDAAELGDDEYTRTWTLPDLPDADFNSLLRLFPVFIGQRQLPRFAAPLQESHDVEAGVTDDIDARAVRFGTGRIWVGSRRRSAGYRGGMWARLVAWCRRMFCR